MENKLKIVANDLEMAQKKLDTSGLDAILTVAGPLLIGDAL